MFATGVTMGLAEWHMSCLDYIALITYLTYMEKT